MLEGGCSGVSLPARAAKGQSPCARGLIRLAGHQQAAQCQECRGLGRPGQRGSPVGVGLVYPPPTAAVTKLGAQDNRDLSPCCSGGRDEGQQGQLLLRARREASTLLSSSDRGRHPGRSSGSSGITPSASVFTQLLCHVCISDHSSKDTSHTGLRAHPCSRMTSSKLTSE